MDIILLQAILLGIVEGLTEFIPVSSTGHLILLIDLIGFQGPAGQVFEIVIQLGAILAVCWLYRERLVRTVVHIPTDPAARNFIRNIVVAFLPAAVLGALLHDFIKTVLFSPYVVSVALILGGVAIILIEKTVKEPRHHEIEKFSFGLALRIGLAQALAMIPGVSRSGATIMGSLLMRVDRKAATEFSFFLAIPTMLGATVYDLYKNWAVLDVENAMVIAVGFLSAFAAAFVVVRAAVAFISQHGFIPFAIYRIFIGVVMLALLLSQGS
ncbi:undecaprenyl-diphosphate phosphatase [Telmatospirillum sp. J64-1]|uniref:undecaprenyl-diphosphate phosphatase n=1 Tax=Telmatospirillum sp. J64-1 TaxID=2502183 RepID=UPI00115D932D|nr:undecaprenyl-diphosphate phosphatase [Telmatospirillum sp. J64-1]